MLRRSLHPIGLPRSLILALPALLVLLAYGQAVEAQARLQRFERAPLAIETAEGERHDFTVELAITPEQQAQGLMFRRDLGDSAGMLFLFGRERPVSFWMKNTLIPLDMLFIDRRGRIVDIAERTVPQSLTSISPGRPVAAVLELNGGTADRLGIAPGDRVLHEAFGTAS